MSKDIKRFLILDGDTGNYLFFLKILQSMGYTHVSHARTGAEALAMVEQELIQFLICAWEIPDMSGTQFIQKVRQKPRRLFTPALIYCKSMSKSDSKLAVECGVEHILHLPFDTFAAKAKLSAMIEEENQLSPKSLKLRKIEEYLRLNHTSEAYPMFTHELFQDHEHSSRTYGLFAEVNLKVGKLDKAHDSITKAYNINPQCSYVKRVYGHVLSRRGEHEEALRIYKDLIAQSPYNIQHRIKLGEAYFEAQHYAEAERTFEDLYKEHKDMQEVRDNMAKVAFRRGNFQLVKKLISELSDGHELVRAFNNMAVGLVKQRSYGEGITAYKEALAMLQDKAHVHMIHYNLGLAYKKKGDIFQAFESFAIAFTLDPHWVKSWAVLQRTYKQAREEQVSLNPVTLEKVRAVRARQA